MASSFIINKSLDYLSIQFPKYKQAAQTAAKSVKSDFTFAVIEDNQNIFEIDLDNKSELFPDGKLNIKDYTRECFKQNQYDSGILEKIIDNATFGTKFAKNSLFPRELSMVFNVIEKLAKNEDFEQPEKIKLINFLLDNISIHDFDIGSFIADFMFTMYNIDNDRIDDNILNNLKGKLISWFKEFNNTNIFVDLCVLSTLEQVCNSNMVARDKINVLCNTIDVFHEILNHKDIYKAPRYNKNSYIKKKIIEYIKELNNSNVEMEVLSLFRKLTVPSAITITNSSWSMK